MNNPYQWNPIDVMYEPYPSLNEWVVWWCTLEGDCIYQGRYNIHRCYKDIKFPNSQQKCYYRSEKR
jgi:hypothetical protein